MALLGEFRVQALWVSPRWDTRPWLRQSRASAPVSSSTPRCPGPGVSGGIHGVLIFACVGAVLVAQGLSPSAVEDIVGAHRVSIRHQCVSGWGWFQLFLRSRGVSSVTSQGFAGRCLVPGPFGQQSVSFHSRLCFGSCSWPHVLREQSSGWPAAGVFSRLPSSSSALPVFLPSVRLGSAVSRTGLFREPCFGWPLLRACGCPS